MFAFTFIFFVVTVSSTVLAPENCENEPLFNTYLVLEKKKINVVGNYKAVKSPSLIDCAQQARAKKIQAAYWNYLDRHCYFSQVQIMQGARIMRHENGQPTLNSQVLYAVDGYDTRLKSVTEYQPQLSSEVEVDGFSQRSISRTFGTLQVSRRLFFDGCDAVFLVPDQNSKLMYHCKVFEDNQDTILLLQKNNCLL